MERSTCAALENGRVKCWGQGLFCRLGLGSETDVGDDAGEVGAYLPDVDLGTGSRVKRLARSSPLAKHMCAVLVSDGTDPAAFAETEPERVKCWGLNNYGRLGLGSGYSSTHRVGSAWNHMGNNLPFVDFSENSSLPEWAVGAPGTVKSTRGAGEIRGSFSRSRPVVARALVQASMETNMHDRTPYLDRSSEPGFSAEWLGGEEPAHLPRAAVSNETRVDFFGSGGVVPWLPESDSPLPWTGARPLPEWSKGALGLTFDAYASGVDFEYFHATAAAVVRLAARSKLELTDLGDWTRRADLDWTNEGGFEPHNEVYERVFEAGTHALDVRASEYHVSDNFWYQFFVPANASDVAQPQPVHLASARS